MTLVICDSSFLIIISKLELLDFLIELFNEIIIPYAVFFEAVKQGKRFKKIDALLIEKRIDDKEIIVEKIKNLSEKEKLMKDFNIHEGEAEAIILYLEKNADLIGTDDYRTLKTCKILKIKYFTSILFIFHCFKNKKLSKERALLKMDKLYDFGWYKKEIIIHFKNKIENSR
ncbi:MAG: hypothetical protein ACP6IY_17665 [Promethearchaeia archaeon]